MHYINLDTMCRFLEDILTMFFVLKSNHKTSAKIKFIQANAGSS